MTVGCHHFALWYPLYCCSLVHSTFKCVVIPRVLGFQHSVFANSQAFSHGVEVVLHHAYHELRIPMSRWLLVRNMPLKN